MRKLLALLVLAFGLIMSVVLHELFHVLMHWGHVIRVDIFPANGNIAQVVVPNEHAGNMVLEEAIAYGITIVIVTVTMLATIKIWRGKNVKSKDNI